MKTKNNKYAVLFGAAFLLLSLSASAQTGNPLDSGQPNMVFKAYQTASNQWVSVAQNAAQTLFGLLALIDFAWTASILALEGHDLNTYMAKIIRKLMTISVFALILSQGQYWMGAIIGSFVKLGQQTAQAAGSTAVTPGQIMADGFDLAAKTLAWAISGASTISITAIAPFFPALFGLFIALAILIAYGIVVVNFIVTSIEALVVVGAGYIFLGFGGSQWTRSYMERYIALAVSIGARLMVLYMVVGLGHTFYQSWLQTLQAVDSTGAITTTGDPTTAIENLCGIFAGVCTYVGVAIMAPRMVGSIMSGSLSLSGNEVIGGAAAAATGVAALGAAALLAAPTGGGSVAAAGAGTLAAGGAGATGAAGAAGAAGAGSTAMAMSPSVAAPAVGSVAAGGGSTVAGAGAVVPPPSVAEVSTAAAGGGGSGGSGGGAAVPPPPSGGGTSTQSTGAAPSQSASTSSPSSNVPPPNASSSGSGGSSGSGSDLKAAANKAQGGIENLTSAIQSGPVEAPPPHINLQGDGE